MAYKYIFADGYICWYAYPLKGADRAWEVKKHGKIVEVKVN